jgi:hypothetical protein
LVLRTERLNALSLKEKSLHQAKRLMPVLHTL